MTKIQFTCGMKYIALVFLVFCFISCVKSEIIIEKENIESFQKSQQKLEKSVLYIREKYLANEYSKSHNIFNIIPSDSNWVRNNIYYDKFLGNLLKGSNIKYVSLKDNVSCDNSESLSELFFVIEPKSDRQYYYVYRFCDSNFKIDESLNYKIIPFNKRWCLEIEKN